MENSLHGKPRVCSAFLPIGVTLLVFKCVCHFLGGQATLGRQTRALIAFLAFTSPSDPKLDVFFFFFLIKNSCSWESWCGLFPAPKGLVSREAEGYRPFRRHRPHPCLIKFPHFHDPASLLPPRESPSLPAPRGPVMTSPLSPRSVGRLQTDDDDDDGGTSLRRIASYR